MNIPKHIWIIMDWNRRWAENKWLMKIAWHKAWADNVEKIVEYSQNIWIKYITLWALSKDNLEKRDENEIKAIIKLIDNIEFFLAKMIKKWLKFETIWDLSKLPEKSQKILNKIKQKTKNNTQITLILALVYSWQDEIIRWFQKVIQEWINISDLNQKNFKKFLDSWIFPEPDLIIRTWWDTRHSWFLLYLSEYSEYYYTNLMWPDFNKFELDKAIESYNSRTRNFWWN